MHPRRTKNAENEEVDCGKCGFSLTEKVYMPSGHPHTCQHERKDWRRALTFDTISVSVTYHRVGHERSDSSGLLEFKDLIEL